MAQQFYCCKKWVSGKLVKFMSPTPCSGGSVPCDQSDPQAPGATTQVREPAGGGDAGGGGGGGTTASPGFGNPPCAGGYFLKRGPIVPGAPGQSRCIGQYTPHYDAATGITWCCPNKDWQMPEDIIVDDTKKFFSLPGEDITKIGERPARPKDGGGEGCAGGYKLTNEFAGGKGTGAAIWNDPNGVLPSQYLRSSDWEGHYVWDPKTQKYYNVLELSDYHSGKSTQMPAGKDNVCRKGFHQEGDWCCPDVGAGAGVGGVSEYWKWPENLQALFKRIEDRIQFLFDYPRGLTDAEKNAIANYATTRIKRGERGEIRDVQERLARAGIAGAGPEFEEVEKIRRGTREDVASVEQALAIDDINRRFGELMQTTGLATDLTGRLAGFETIIESINAARRGEGRQDMGMFLHLLSMLMGSGQDSSYNQAIMNWIMNQGGGQGGGDYSWLAWLPYM